MERKYTLMECWVNVHWVDLYSSLVSRPSLCNMTFYPPARKADGEPG